MSDKLFLLDGMALVYRSHFAFMRNPIMTSAGMNTSAVYGFANTLLNILESEQPSHIAVAFDTKEPTERHAKFEEYKATREALPEDIEEALPYIDRLIKGFNITVLVAPGYEADDIVGTVVRSVKDDDVQTYMVTPDKDFAQLVNDRTFLYRPARKGGGFETLGMTEVLEAWEVERVDQVIDVLALMGDSADNIPGIPGVGEKTAKKLIAKFGSVEKLLESTGELKGKQKENVVTYADQGLLSKELVSINCEVPVPFSLKDLRVGERDDASLKKLFAELEFNSLGDRLFGEAFKAGRGKGFSGVVDDGAAGEEQGELFGGTLKTLADVEHVYELVEGDLAIGGLVEKLQKQESFCLDTETSSLDPRTTELVGIAFAWKPGHAVYVPFPPDPKASLNLLERFRALLEDGSIEKIGHNLKFDLEVLRWHGIEVAGPFFDTMIAHALVDPEQRHNMDFLAESRLGYTPVSIATLIGERREEQRSMRELEPQEIVDYAAEDADITLQLRHSIGPELKDVNAERLFREMEAQLMPVLADMEYEGIGLDTSALAEFSVTLGASIDSLRSQIFDQAGCEFNLNSPKQLGEILFDTLKLEKDPKKTKTGQYQTNEQVLTRLAVRFEIARHILQYRGATKLKSTYVDALPSYVLEKTGRIHTTYAQVATATGRLASNGPNLQNIPIRSAQGQEIRKAFIPRSPDRRLLSADYSQIELRIMAELSGDPGMLEAFEKGQDIHDATAARVYSVELDAVSLEMRRQAKMINYGLMYGMSVFGLSQRLGIPRKDAQGIVESYFAQFPGIKSYIDQTIEFAKENGFVETISGRRRYLRDINSRNNTTRMAMERNAVNTPIQGTGADMIKTAMVQIHEALREAGLESKMILQIHDELVFDVVASEIDQVREIVETNMIEAIPMRVPIEVDIGVGKNWLEAH